MNKINDKTKQLEEAINSHINYINIGLDIRAALVNVTEQIKVLNEIYDQRTFSDVFRKAIVEERERLYIESSAMHVIIREMESKQ